MTRPTSLLTVRLRILVQEFESVALVRPRDATCRRTNSAASAAQPLPLILGPAGFDRHVLALDVAGGGTLAGDPHNRQAIGC